VSEGSAERGAVPVRAAVVGDASRVARLLHEFNTEFGNATPGVEALTERLRVLLAGDETSVQMAGAGPEGLAVTRYRPALWSEGLEAYLQELYVVPEHRGRGTGRALLEATVAAAREAGAVRIELGTSVDDVVAIALYESAGFTNLEGQPDGPSMLVYEREL
jgi:ribosomal protein S18 acetylase RimI-like enzyme